MTRRKYRVRDDVDTFIFTVCNEVVLSQYGMALDLISGRGYTSGLDNSFKLERY